MRRQSMFKSSALDIRWLSPALILILCAPVMAQTTAFTYQGLLKDGGVIPPNTNSYDFQFRVLDGANVQQGAIICFDNHNLTNGLFTFSMDFGNVFPGAARFLEIGVRPGGAAGNCAIGSYTILSPGAPQMITSAPYSVMAANSGSLGGQAGSFYQSATNITAGTLADGRLSANVMLLNNTQTASGAKTFSNAANSFTGVGTGLTALNATNVASGTLADARLSANVALLNNVQTFSGAKTFSTAPSFTAVGAPMSITSTTLVTNLNADLLDGQSGAFYQNAGSLNAGTVADARLSANVALLNATQTFTGVNSFSNDMAFTSDQATLGFPAAAAGNAPMITMFASGTGNADRMVIAHSLAFPTYGLQYQDSTDKFNFLSSGTPVLTADLGNQRVGIGTTAPAFKLDVTDRIRLRQGASGSAGLWLYQTTPAADHAFVGMNTDTQVGLYGTSGAGWGLVMDTGTGDVGIGTTAPSKRVHVSSANTAGTSIRIDEASSANFWAIQTTGSASPTGINNFLIRDEYTDQTVVSIEEAGHTLTVRDGSNNPTILLSGNSGQATVKVLTITGADVAEKFPVSDTVEPGTVVEIDPDRVGQLRVSREAYCRRVAGIASGAGDLQAGAILGNIKGNENAPPIALSGRVWCKCDTSNGPVVPGDLLTTSNTPGHAMKATDDARMTGAIIGKAMSSLKNGKGLVLVLVSGR